MSRKKILLIEDETNLLNSLGFILEREGFEVRKAVTGEEGVRLALEEAPDLALVDIGLPGIDGFEVASKLKELRSSNGTIVVFLTGRDEEDDIVRAFEGLADDYVVKPVRPRALMARLGALLSRRRGRVDDNADAVSCGPLEINPASFEAYLNGEQLALTPTEFKILLLLSRNQGRALSRDAIIAEVHGDNCHLTEKSVDFQIHELRQKLGARAGMLTTVRGVGFKLKADSKIVTPNMWEER